LGDKKLYNVGGSTKIRGKIKTAWKNLAEKNGKEKRLLRVGKKKKGGGR